VGVDLATTAATAYRDLLTRGVGRQVLTVLAGVRKSWRPSGDVPWPPLDGDGHMEVVDGSAG
jgi:hypothetical protein